MENKLYSLGKKYNTDKVTHHEYHNIYDFFLNKFYEKEGSILEIGVQNSYSINMWLELFTKAFIYGADISFEKSGNRFKIFKADQSSPTDLNNLKMELSDKNLFFINDDGSHIPEHQILTFNTLFPLLEEGGIYIIEDIETSYWTKGEIFGYPTRYGYKHPSSIIEIFKDALDGVNTEFAGNIESKIDHMNLIGNITFSRNCIIIVKQTQKKRNYRFWNRL